VLPSPQGIDLYTAYAIGVSAFHNCCCLWFVCRKSIKKEELACTNSSLFLAARDSHQTIPNDIYKKDYLTNLGLLGGIAVFRNRGTKLFFIFYLVYF
jgi:hypothetical protein